MPEFILDHGDSESAARFQQLDAFTQGYIEALFFTDEEQLCEESGRDMPDVAVNLETMESRFVGGDSPGFGDLAETTLAMIIADCERFQRENAALLELAYARDYDSAQAGRDFWFTRNGHGVGYWDRDVLGPDRAAYDGLTDIMRANPVDSVAWRAARIRRESVSADSIGERLAAVARAFGGSDSYVGDDGLVYLG